MLKTLVKVENFFTWLANLIITDDYLERREQEWREADEREFYLS